MVCLGWESPGGFELPLSCLYLRNAQPPHMLEIQWSGNYESEEDAARTDLHDSSWTDVELLNLMSSWLISSSPRVEGNWKKLHTHLGKKKKLPTTSSTCSLHEEGGRWQLDVTKGLSSPAKYCMNIITYIAAHRCTYLQARRPILAITSLPRSQDQRYQLNIIPELVSLMQLYMLLPGGTRELCQRCTAVFDVWLKLLI